LKSTVAVEPETLAPFFALLVERIVGGSQDAIHELQLHFLRGIKYLLTRQLGRDRSDELAQDVLAAVINAIRNGEVHEPERLPAFVQAVVQQTIALAHNYLGLQAESRSIRMEDLAIAGRVLRSLPSRDREILLRFYCQEQPPEMICLEMGVTATEFHIIKNRARDKFGQPSAIRKNI
jgi:RNA polymerase sigma-70 factor (ECF subfamily)